MLGEIARDINKVQSQISDIRTILGLSVNLKDFAYFKQNMPVVRKIREGKTGDRKFWIPEKERKYDIKVVKNCLKFVIELALKSE